MKGVAVPPLRMLFWESTARCNLSCSHCRRLDVEPGADELSTAEAGALFDSVARLGRAVIVFSGGEPLLRDDWEELADYARRLGLPTALATNGTLIDPSLAGRIASAGFRRVAVSIDGPDAETHDAFRGGGNFKKALAGLDNCRRAGSAVQLNVTVTGRNVERLDELYDLARDRRAEAMHLFMLVPVGCGEKIAESQQVTPSEYRRVLNWIYDRRQDGAMELRATCGPQYYPIAARRGPMGGEHKSRGCLCGISVAFVSHRGEVFPCGYLPVHCGSVRREGLEDIWKNSEVFTALRDYDRLEGRCGACEFKKICGGCRARAYAATGNYLAEEPSCCVEMTNYEFPNEESMANEE